MNKVVFSGESAQVDWVVCGLLVCGDAYGICGETRTEHGNTKGVQCKMEARSSPTKRRFRDELLLPGPHPMPMDSPQRQCIVALLMDHDCGFDDGKFVDLGRQ